jgi:hypothetical protein
VNPEVSCVDWVILILLKAQPLSTKKATKGRKSGLSGEMRDLVA